MSNREMIKNQDGCCVWLQMDVKEINFLNRIMEGYSHIGALTTYDRQAGIVFIRCTPDTKRQVEEVIRNLPFEIRRIDSYEKSAYKN